MQIGLFGGTFDPIHLGHLILAERVREEARLDAVWFMPSYLPPHKVGDVVTPFDIRTLLTRLAIEGHPHFRVETIERDLPPPSYTAHTLAALQRDHPKDTFHLIVGADCLPDLPKWHEPKQVLARASLLAVPRPGIELWNAERVAASLAIPVSQVRLRMIDCPLMAIASREIRQRVAAGKSIRYLVPQAVEEQIRQKKLYLP